MKAAVLHGINDIKLENVPIPKHGNGDVLIRVKASGICGSDIPRVMVTGTYKFPTIPGHEFAGEVSEIGGDVEDIKLGDRVAVIPCIPCKKCRYCQAGEYFHCEHYDYLGSRSDGGFAEYVKVPKDNIVKLPQGLDWETACGTEPAAVALHVLKRGGINIGDKVAVFGMGSIGNLIAQWAGIMGAGNIFAIDIQDEKLNIARVVGLKDIINSRNVDVLEFINNFTDSIGVDLSIEAAGSEEALKQAIQVTRRLGRIILVGRAEKDIVFNWDIFASILRKELTIYGSWGFDFNEFPTYAWQTCLKFMANGRIKIKPFITHRFKLEDVKNVFDMMYRKEEFYNKVIFIP